MKVSTHFQKAGKRTKGARRYSGGISILIKQNLIRGVKIIDEKCEGFLWVKLCKDFSTFHKIILFVLFTYHQLIPLGKENLMWIIFTTLNEQILKYRSQGDIILCGDFNSRIGNLPDFIPPDQFNSQSDKFFISNADRFVPPVRNTKDKIVNSYGRKHIDTCISHNLKIVNGRASGDLLGKYTCYNVKGSSTVDLFITTDALLTNIIQLKVSTPRFRSCHCMVNMTMKVDQLVIEEPTLHEFPPNFVWNNLYKRDFIEQLQNKDIIIQLDKLNNDIKNILISIMLWKSSRR